MRRFTAMPRSEDGEITASEWKSDRRLRYGGALVSAASALPLNADAIRPRPVARLVAAGLRRPRCLAALIALLVRTPTEYVSLSGTPAGRALDDYFSQRSLWVVPRKRFCRGVLLLPEDHAVYLRGRRREAVRRNLRRAEAAGIHCEVVSDRRRALDDISQVLHDHRNWLTDVGFQAVADKVRATAKRPETTVTVARDEDGRPLAIAATVIDDMVCLINAAVATSHEARWALHDHLVRLLIARRVRYLLADGEGPFGALGYGANVQHYQYLLGYELRHVIPAGTHRMTRRWRLVVASLILVAASVAVVVPRAAASPGVSVNRTTSHRALQGCRLDGWLCSGGRETTHGQGRAGVGHRITPVRSTAVKPQLALVPPADPTLPRFRLQGTGCGLETWVRASRDRRLD